MARTKVGLDIGSTCVRAAEVAPGDVPVLLRAAQVRLEPSAVENGEVRQPEAVATALKELWSVGGFKAREVLMGMGNQRVVVREVTLP
jgi:type IV pilus assembly protein PilM